MSRIGARKKTIIGVALAIILASSALFFLRISRPRPLVGVIKIRGYFLQSGDLNLYSKALELAYYNDTIKAVVIRIDSGGGSASISEELYKDIKALSRKKPVIALIEGIGASGAYYVALGAREIYCTPSSIVGGIGVIASVPPIVLPTEQIAESGAYKLSGFSPRDIPLLVKEVFRGFIRVIRESRGDKINASVIDEISTGRLYLGSTAVELGLVDGISSYLETLRKAAEEGGIWEYRTVDLTELAKTKLSANGSSIGYKLWSEGRRVPLSLLQELSSLKPEPYFLPTYMVEGSMDVPPEYLAAQQLASHNAEEQPLNNTVVIDATHGNAFSPLLLTELLGRIVELGGRSYILSGEKIQDVLKRNPASLVIFTPKETYSSEEISAIKKYVRGGGRLLIVHDPALYFPVSINVLSQEFGMVFAVGFLYNSKENYGIYRNLIVRNFSDHPVVANISEIVIFTGTAIYTNSTPIAWSSNDTLISITDTPGKYAIMATNGTVLALSDSTLLLDPFITIADNRELVDNLARWLLGEE